MKKWLIILGILTLGTLLGAIPALANSSDSITVTATGYIAEAPGGLTLTYISDYEIGISWIKGTDAVNTMVRVKDGSVPTSRIDGNLVYYGDGTSTSDTGVNFDESAATKYYRAWSQNSAGAWEEVGTSDFMESALMTLLGILAFCGIMSFIALRSNFFGLKLVAGMSWFAFFMFFKNNPPSMISEGNPEHTAILIIAIGFGLMIVLSGLGRGIQRSQKWGEGFEQSEGFQWKLPSWLKASEDEPEQRTRATDEALRDYRETLRRAYRTGEFRRRR